MATNDVLDSLRERVQRAGTQKDAAKSLGISGPYLCDLLHGRRPFSDRILWALGFERVVVKAGKR